MNNPETSIETLFEKVENYAKITAELFKLHAIDKSANIFSSLGVQMILFVFFVLFLFSINIGISLWIGQCLGKLYYGFFVVAALNAIIISIVFVFRMQWIKAPIRNYIIKQIMVEDKYEKV